MFLIGQPLIQVRSLYTAGFLATGLLIDFIFSHDETGEKVHTKSNGVLRDGVLPGLGDLRRPKVAVISPE